MLRSIGIANFLAKKMVSRSSWGLNVVAVLMIVLVYVNLNFTSSLLNGFVKTVNDKLISAQTGNIVVLSKTADGISEATKLMEDIRKIEGVEGVTGSRSLPGQISKGNERSVAEISGIDTESYGDVFVTPENMIEGEFLNSTDTDKIVLGAQIAGADRTRLELYSDSLKNVHVGDKVMVSYPGGVKKEYIVKGIFLNKFFESDLKTFINNQEFDEVQPASNVENINIKLTPGTDEQAVISKISNMRSDLQFRTWEERAGFVRGFTDTLDIVNRILRSVALLVAAATIFIVTYVDLVSKRRQIGIERAIGINSSTIITSYLIRAFFYTVIGSVIGVILFVGVVMPVERAYPFTFPYGEVYLVVSPQFMFLNALILIGVGLISALIPAWRSMRISIIDAIWGN